jgi:hypothetical protein
MTCIRCHQAKQVYEYTPGRKYCRTCRNEADRATGREAMRRHRLRTKFGITEEQLESIREAQGGVCAICERPETMRRNGRLLALSIDHDHYTGQVRGLLCSACNTGIGKLQDSPALLRRALEYLST